MSPIQQYQYILAGAYDLELSGVPELGSIQSNRWNIAYNVQIW